MFVEGNLTAQLADDNCTSADFTIDQDDTFLVWNGRDDVWDDQAYSHFVQYNSVDTNEQVLTFEDLAVGTKEFTYQAVVDTCLALGADGTAVIGTGQLILGGNAYSIWVSNATGNPIAVDLNADGDVASDLGKFTTKGGGVIQLANLTTVAQNDDGINGDPIRWTLHTESSEFDETDEGSERLEMDISEDSDNQVQMSFGNYSRISNTAATGTALNVDRQNNVYIEGVGVVSTTGNSRYVDFKFDPQQPDSDDDHEFEMTDYGVMYDLYDPTGSQPEELTLMYPNGERGVQVFITAGATTATKGGVGGVTTTMVNPIAVGLAVLDVDAPAVGSENMISIGGPCINMVSAELLGVTFPACGADAAGLGFEEGKATIKLFGTKTQFW
jgi:hypothetical protein